MKKILLLLTHIFLTQFLQAQVSADQKFSKIALQEDLNFLKSQLFNAHANPFSELDSLVYDARFLNAQSKLQDSMTAFDLVKLAKPLFAPLSDEHARVSFDNSFHGDAKIFMPFSIQMRGDAYVIKALLSNEGGLKTGDTLIALEGIPMADVIRQCSDYTTGFPDQRVAKSMAQFGLVYIFAYPYKTTYQIETSHLKQTISGVSFKDWMDYGSKNNKQGDCKDLISYTPFGQVGYINYCSFSIRSDSMFSALELKMADIFKQIKKDKIKTLVVDVSNNAGGSSDCGDLIINYFTTQTYLGYQCKWKRSDEYLALIKSWGHVNEDYQKTPVGTTISYKSYTRVPTRRLKNRFKGKVYVVVGPNTFSSAIMFATIVKDNHLAELVGQIPENGHPNHFGEMYGSKTPNTKLQLQFGVKEWIRPSGARGENYLIPDKTIELSGVERAQDLIDRILH